MHPNSLYFGDNLRWLRDREHFPDESVDLVYLDPPFNSQRDYNMVFRDQATADDTAQVKAFEDTWSFSGAQADFDYVTTNHDRLSRLLDALKRTYSGDHAMLSMVGYLAVIAARLIELHRVLKPTGSLYLHCDDTAGPYLKMILDAVFGPGCYRNEIVWKRTSAHSDTAQGGSRYGRVTDTIWFYTKGDGNCWRQQYRPYDQSYIERDYRRTDPDGRRYRISDMSGPGGAEKGNPYYEVMGVWRHWRYSQERMAEFIAQGRVVQTRPGAVPQLKRYLDEMPGAPVQNLWDDVPVINNRSAERLGYPTQKPLALLERIISASSEEGDLVLDPFCGCGTAVVAAHKLGRRWIGIDITSLATSTIKKRLLESFVEAFPTPAAIPVMGFPVDLAGARELALSDRHNFQNWILSLIPTARPKGGAPKKGADQGIDGVWMWQDGRGDAQRGIISVKSGHVNAAQVRDLVGTMAAENAAMGLFVTLEPPTKPMQDAAAVAGSYQLAGTTANFPVVQIVSAEDLLAGKLPQQPLASRIESFKQAQVIDESRPHPELPW
jgi:site-specific DNA-methyltransferase (adenine-specific)